MKIHRLQVTIEPGDYANWKLVTLTVEANGKRVETKQEMSDDDFTCRFDWFMEDAKRIIKDKLK